MANGVELAAAYISLTPTARNITRDLQREIVQPADKAGKDAGKAIEDGIGTGANRGAQAARTAVSLISSAAILSGLNRAKDAASGLQQAVGGTTAVFQESSAVIDDWAEGSAEAVGLSQRAARELTSQIGASLKGYGFAVDEAAAKSIELAELGADLAATFGGTTADAVGALGSALRGEFDPLERYGIALRQSAIDAKAVELGLAESTTEVDALARAQAALTIITEQSADAQGQFAREADSAAGQAQIASAKQEDAAADLGEALLPIYARISETVGTVADAFAALPSSVQTGILALAGVVAIAGPISNVVGLYRQLTPAVQANTATTIANTAATNSAASVQTLYARNMTASAVATRALSAAGAALAAAGIAATVKQIHDETDGLRVDLEGAAAATTDELVRSFERLGGTEGSVAIEFFEELANGSAASFAAATQLRDALAATGTDVSELTVILEEAGEASGRSADRTEEGTEALAGYSTAAEDATGSTRPWAEIQAEAADRAEAHAEAVEDIRSSMSDYVTDAFAAQDAAAAWLQALDDLTESIEQNGSTLDLNTEAGRENFRQGREVAEGLVELMQTRFDETGSVQAAIDAGELYVEQLKNQLREAGLTEEQVQDYIDTLNLTPRDIATNFRANTAAAVQAIQELQRIAAGVAANSYEIDYAVRTPGARATGGPVWLGTPYTVNERGREIFVPSTDGTILSREDSIAAVAMAARPSGMGAEIEFAVGMAAGASPIGSRSVVQNFYGPTDPERAGREVRRVHMTMRD